MFVRKAITAKLRHLCLSHNGLFFSQRNSTMAGAGIQKKKKTLKPYLDSEHFFIKHFIYI